MRVIKYLTLSLSAFLFSSSVLAQFNPVELSQKFKGEPYVLLSNNVTLEVFFNDEGKPKAKQKIRREYFTLVDGVHSLSRFLIHYNPHQEVKINMARYYGVDSLGKKMLFHNIKTKFIEERDYYIDGYFYSDSKVKEIETDFFLERWNYIIIDYEVVFTDLKFLTPIYLNPRGEHVLKFKMDVRHPSNIELDIVEFNFENVSEDQSAEDNKWTFKDVRSYKEGKYSPPYNYVLPHMVPVIRSIDGENFLSDAGDLFKWYDSLIQQLTLGSSYCNNAAVQIVGNLENDIDKIKAIYNYVQKNINYIAFEDGIAGFKPEESNKVLSSGYGDCKGVSNLLVDFLSSQGIKAGHAWIGTRSLNYSYELASLNVDNHMVCWVEIDGELHILDATGKFFNWNQVPYNLQGKEILLRKGSDQYEVMTLPIRVAEENNIDLKGSVVVNAKGKDKFTGEISINGNEAIKMISGLNGLNSQSSINYAPIILDHYFDDTFVDIRVLSASQSAESESIKLEFEADLLGGKIVSNNQMYCFPSIGNKILSFDNNNLASYFDNSLEYSINIEYKLPNGASLLSSPEEVRIVNEDFEFSRSLAGTSDTYKLSTIIKIKSLYQGVDKADVRKEISESNRSLNSSPLIINL